MLNSIVIMRNKNRSFHNGALHFRYRGETQNKLLVRNFPKEIEIDVLSRTNEYSFSLL